MKKYCLTDETMKNDSGATLHRIQALIDIPRAFVKAGDQGGWIEKEKTFLTKDAAGSAMRPRFMAMPKFTTIIHAPSNHPPVSWRVFCGL